MKGEQKSLSPLEHKELLRIGNNIRDLRLSRGWSQEKLAELTGLHDRTIGKIERGGMNFSILTLLKLVRALNSSPNRLVMD